MECIDISEHCRACQIRTKKTQKIFIFTTMKISDIFRETTSLDIHENDGLSKVICSSCYDRLLEAYNFRKMCSATAIRFRKILSVDIPVEKYSPLENSSDAHLTDTILMDVKAETDLDPPDSSSSDKEDPLSGISDMLFIDEKLPEILKTDSDLNCRPQERNDPLFPENRTRLECGICNSSFNRKSQLEMHIRKEHLRSQPRECRICRKKFKSTSSLRNHLATHVTKDDARPKSIDQNVCGIFGVETSTAQEMRSHMNIHKKDNMWSCGFCPYQTDRKNSMQRHVKVVHRKIKEHHCSRCDRSFGTAKCLKDHIMLHTGERPHACSECDKRFIRLSELKIHMNIHTGENVFSCEFCSYKTVQAVNMRNHVKIVHQGVRDYHCPHCEQSFTAGSTLKQHIRRHEGIKNHECRICGVKTVTSSELKSHIDTMHTMEKKWSCQFCPYKSSVRGNLTKHVKAIHQKIKDYHCSQCDKSFFRARDLKNHEMVHSGERPHACSKCPKRFIILYQLKAHMNSHT